MLRLLRFLSGYESDESDWSIGWLEPLGSDFESNDNDDEDDSSDNSFALVPCYSHGCKEVESSNNVLLKTENRQSKRNRAGPCGGNRKHLHMFLHGNYRNDDILKNVSKDWNELVEEIKVTSWRWSLGNYLRVPCMLYEWCWNPKDDFDLIFGLSAITGISSPSIGFGLRLNFPVWLLAPCSFAVLLVCGGLGLLFLACVMDLLR
ncbi:hypothetical protein L195_g004620 [Trifolium pratense]|uniref:Uncharacterized protein n=1 Tax=Trifolium pratense TaxID=57577 RepID=A0A2K3NYJ2_TRIPR|nr:hypothetical protein L195_g004620 [Trifolium pratense]